MFDVVLLLLQYNFEQESEPIYQPWHYHHPHLLNCFYPFWACSLRVCFGTRASVSDPAGRPMWTTFVCPAHPTDAQCACSCETMGAQSTVGLSFVQLSPDWPLEASWWHSGFLTTESVFFHSHNFLCTNFKLLHQTDLPLLKCHWLECIHLAAVGLFSIAVTWL